LRLDRCMAARASFASAGLLMFQVGWPAFAKNQNLAFPNLLSFLCRILRTGDQANRHGTQNRLDFRLRHRSGIYARILSGALPERPPFNLHQSGYRSPNGKAIAVFGIRCGQGLSINIHAAASA
jgi:hypothetical protein